MKCLNVDACIYSVCPFGLLIYLFVWWFVVVVVVVGPVDVDVDNVQRRELVTFHGVLRYIRDIVIAHSPRPPCLSTRL